jgi:exonuclease III
MSRFSRQPRKRPQNGLRIVTWNCRGALHKKLQTLLALGPDIAVIQECAEVDRWRTPDVSDALWCGANRSKGLAVAAFRGLTLQSLDLPVADLSYFIPTKILGPIEFGLLGVWTKPGAGLGYTGQIAAAIERCHNLLVQQPCVVAGDWNSNAIFPFDRNTDRHLQLVDAMDLLGMTSAYHAWHQCPQGREWHTTHRHSLGNYFHIDYCFVPHAWATHLTHVEVGGDSWFKFSDHAPIIVDVALPFA